jgi:hypothetical protein
MEDEPKNGNQNDTNPKAWGDERVCYAVPIVDIKVFVGLAEEIEQRPGKYGRDPINEEIDAGQFFLVHHRW